MECGEDSVEHVVISGTEIALIITASGAFVTSMVGAAVSIRNAFNIQRIEKNTNSISQRNEDIAKKLGIQEGRQAQRDHPFP